MVYNRVSRGVPWERPWRSLRWKCTYIVRELSLQVCNVAAGPMAMNADRVSAMQPLPAYFYADAGHMAGRRQVYSTDVFGYIYAFDEQVWMALGIALLATAVVMVLFQNNFKRVGAVRKFVDYVFLLFAMLLTKGPSRCPDNTRVLIGVWWVAVIFTTTTFTSYMQASMTVKTEMPRIESVKDFVNRPDILPVIIDGMAFDIILNTSTFPEDNQLWRRIQKLQSQWSFKRVFSQDTYEDVLDGKKVVFMEQSLYHYGVQLLYPDEPPKGQFYFGKEKRVTLPTSMYVSYDAPQRVKKSLHRMSRWICESGMIDMHLNNVLLKTWKMLDLQQLSANALSVDDVFGLFALLAIGMALAATALLVECVQVAVRKLRKPKITTRIALSYYRRRIACALLREHL
ncbi:uncharacterized protein LOC115332841 [Ixodes scapularis]|uniref:uncharacterized protein LOC115332841 n=1 Tax=Ixodes scapularis TaxID=6945 RepID=UPI001A9D2BD6|nr:uncharacterized protein LOC115332841 [Ixodes scapularis]